MTRVRQSTGRTASTHRDLASNHPTMVVYFESRHRDTTWPEMAVQTSPPADSPVAALLTVPPPTGLAAPVPEATPPMLASPALVLVAALSIMEGYRWLNVIPARRLHPSALIYVAVAIPLLLICTRERPGGRRGWVQWIGLASVAGLTVATVIEIVVNRPWSAHLFGASNLAVAVASLGAAWAIGRTDSTDPQKGGGPTQ